MIVLFYCLILFSCKNENISGLQTKKASPQSRKIVFKDSQKPVENPLGSKQLTSSLPALQTLPEAQQKQIIAVLNLVPSPCSACQSGNSIASCLQLPNAKDLCPVLHLIGERLIDQVVVDEATSTKKLVDMATYSDLWYPQPTQGRKAVSVELWFDVNAKATVAAFFRVLELNNAELRFQPIVADNNRYSERLWKMGWLKLKPEGQKMSENKVPDKKIDYMLDLFNKKPSRAGSWGRKSFAEQLPLHQKRVRLLGVRSTPTWFIEGFRLRGLQSTTSIQRIIDLALLDRKAQ